MSSKFIASLVILFSCAVFADAKDVDAKPKPESKPESKQDVLYPQLPKWEVGALAGLFRLPDYPGAGQSQTRMLILPYFIYRGEVVRVERDSGLRGRFFNTREIEFDVSVGAAFPTSSGENDARANMPNLDWTGEVGPRMTAHLHRGRMIKIDLRLPMRYVFSTDFGRLDSRGYVFEPELNFRHRALFDENMFFSFGGGPMWGNESINDYFYEVSPQYARADRPVYDAEAGYMGTHFYLAMARIVSKTLTIYGGFSQSNYSAAKNRSSPLLRDIETESYFLGLSWGLLQEESKRPNVDEDPIGD